MRGPRETRARNSISFLRSSFLSSVKWDYVGYQQSVQLEYIYYVLKSCLNPSLGDLVFKRAPMQLNFKKTKNKINKTNKQTKTCERGRTLLCP